MSVFRNSQMDKICNKLRCFWCNIMEFTIRCSTTLKFGDFDFFGEFHDVTPKTPMHQVLQKIVLRWSLVPKSTFGLKPDLECTFTSLVDFHYYLQVKFDLTSRINFSCEQWIASINQICKIIIHV